MSRPMRRPDRELPEAEAWRLLAQADHGVLATVDAEGQPYAVPLNHVLVDHALYIHCALDGHKLDNLEANPRVSYCVITHGEVEPAAFSTAFESAIAFGTARIVDDESERTEALRALNVRFAPGLKAEGEAMIEKHLGVTSVLRLDITHVTAKARRAGTD